MAFVSDFTKSPQQIILDLVNNDNTSSITPALVTFGLPTAATGTPVKNTDLTLTAVAGSGYSGSQTIHYDRVDLSTIPGTRSIIFQKGDAVNIADLIPEINAAYQLNLTADDFVDGALPTFTGTPNEEHDFQLVAGANSLPFVNSVTLTVKADDIPLSSAIPNASLNGLVYTQPAAQGA